MTRRSTISVYMMDLLATVPYYTAYLCRALLQRGVDVRVGSITYYLDLHCFRSRDLKLDPGCLDVVGRLPWLPRILRRIAKLLETGINVLVLAIRFLVRPPQILHVQFLPMLRSRVPLDWWLMRFVRWRGARVVLTVHDLMPHDTADQYHATFLKLYSSVDQLICHSGTIQTRLEAEFGVAPSRVHVIPHGPFFYDLPAHEDTQLRSRYGILPEQKVALWQGIIFPYKGLDLLLKAWASVETQVPDVTLIVAGTGSADTIAELRSQVEQLNLQRVVLDLRFTSTEELVSLYRTASIVIYPYRAITTSGALATGISLGKAIVASDLPVFRELLTNGVDALLVPAGDVAALAHGIVRLFQDPTLREQFEIAMQQKDFGSESWKSIAGQTEVVYQAALTFLPSTGAQNTSLGA